MIYGGKPPKPVPPSKEGVSIPTPFRGPRAYEYGFVSISILFSIKCYYNIDLIN